MSVMGKLRKLQGILRANGESSGPPGGAPSMLVFSMAAVHRVFRIIPALGHRLRLMNGTHCRWQMAPQCIGQAHCVGLY
jgi:hypothetical protein